jgi:hypothetical protein
MWLPMRRRHSQEIHGIALRLLYKRNGGKLRGHALIILAWTMSPIDGLRRFSAHCSGNLNF